MEKFNTEKTSLWPKVTVSFVLLARRLSTHYSVMTAHKGSLGQGNIFTGVCPWEGGCVCPWSYVPSRGFSVQKGPYLGGLYSGTGLCCSWIFFTFSKSVHPSRCKINRKSNIACISIQVTLYIIRLIIAQINNIKDWKNSTCWLVWVTIAKWSYGSHPESVVLFPPKNLI